jgi:hypothetical protein
VSLITYRGNLSAKALPFLTDFQGRTVIVAGPDNTFNRSLVSTEDVDRDVGVAIAYYAHNVIPAPFGFQSVGYESIVEAITPASTLFEDVEIIVSNALSASVKGPRVFFSPQFSGAIYTLALGDTVWTACATSVPYTQNSLITYATVQGITYIYFTGQGCYKYNSATNALIAVTLTGLVAANILGIASFQGYLIAFDASTIYWSSTLDIDYTLNSVDFTPSLTTGAGSLKLEGAKGPITFLKPATFGLAVYTTVNIVSAVYSGNSRYPFNFKEIVASGGCADPDLVTYDTTTGNQYVYSTSGLQLLSSTSTDTKMPEVTDFIAGANFEDFDEATLTFSFEQLSIPLKKRITSIADRYMIISYGKTSLTHAIVYDMSQKRYGKLKVPHVDCFEYEYLDPAVVDVPRKSIAFLQSSGAIVVVDTEVDSPRSSGVILLGKFQYVRARLLTLEEVVMQSVGLNQSCAAYDFASVKGGTIDSCTKYTGYNASVPADRQKIFKFHNTALNHSIMFVGGFSLSSFVLAFHVHGNR